MRNLLVAVSAVAVLAACDNLDPTDKDDMSCTVSSFEGVTIQACTQLHITEAEALLAKPKCEDSSGINGSWSSNPCSATGRISGYCKIEASQYSLSGTDAKVFLYGEDTDVNRTAAQALCLEDGGTWIQ